MMPRPIARTGLALVVALLSSGCVTASLWELQPATRLAVDARHRAAAAVDVLAEPRAGGALLIYARRGGDEPLPVASGLAARRSFWRLEPDRAAEEARRLFRRGEFEVERIDVRMRREVIGHDVDCSAEVEVEARAVRSLRPRAIDPAGLPAGVLDAVVPVGMSDLSPDHVTSGLKSALLVQCVNRLRHLAPGLWSGPLVGCAWLDADGRVLSVGAKSRLLQDLAMDDAPGGHLDALGELQLLAAVERAGGREWFVLEPDRVWLWGGLDIDGDRVRHRSEWLALPVERPHPPSWVAVGDGAMRLDFLCGRIERDHVTNVALKLLLTPVAVVVDTAVFLLEFPSGRPFDREASRRRLR